MKNGAVFFNEKHFPKNIDHPKHTDLTGSNRLNPFDLLLELLHLKFSYEWEGTLHFFTITSRAVALIALLEPQPVQYRGPLLFYS